MAKLLLVAATWIGVSENGVYPQAAFFHEEHDEQWDFMLDFRVAKISREPQIYFANGIPLGISTSWDPFGTWDLGGS